MNFRERERAQEREGGRGERELRSKQGISFLQRGMKRDMGEFGLG